MSERSRMYKNLDKDGAELRRRRQGESVELRKAKKLDVLHKRRNIVAADGDDSFSDVAEQSQTEILTASKTNQDQSEATIHAQELIRFSKSGDVDLTSLTTCVQNCRKVLSRARDPPIDEFVNAGAVPVLIFLLQSHVPNDIQFEATWALTNIASGSSEHTKAVVDADGVDALIPLLESPKIEIAEQAVWALGNIAGEGSNYRDLVIDKGIVDPLLRLFENSRKNAGILSNIAWVMSNLCRCKNSQPSPGWVLERLIPVLGKIVLQKDVISSPDAQIDATWALTYASESSQESIPWILQSGAVKQLVHALNINSPIKILAPSLRCIGNLVTGSDETTDAVLEFGILKYMDPLLKHSKPSIVKEACWLVSNITAGTAPQIQLVVKAKIMPRVLNVLSHGDNKSQREALWAVSNYINGATNEQLEYIVSIHLLSNCQAILKDVQPKNILLCLEMLSRVMGYLKENGKLEEGAVEFESAGGVDLLEKLQEHENEQVYTAALALVEQYFMDESADVAEEQKEFSFAQANNPGNNQSFSF